MGRDSGEPVTGDYPGEHPYPFTGGTIRRVAVDVSGEPYVDLEREAAAMLSREYPDRDQRTGAREAPPTTAPGIPVADHRRAPVGSARRSRSRAGRRDLTASHEDIG